MDKPEISGNDIADEIEADNERLAKAFREANLVGDAKPEGTRESLSRCAVMLDAYAPNCFPANNKGQVHFARAMMESVADEIRAFLEATKPWPTGVAPVDRPTVPDEVAEHVRLTPRDWREGLLVTPKFSSHPFYRQTGRVQKVIGERIIVGMWQGEGVYDEPAEEWMTA